MFPHTITIYRHTVADGKDVFVRQTVSGVYWYGSTGLIGSGKGAETDGNVTVITSPALAATYGTGWTCLPGDRIMKGIGKDITSWKQLSDGRTVLGVEESICGSPVDCVTISGK